MPTVRKILAEEWKKNEDSLLRRVGTSQWICKYHSDPNHGSKYYIFIYISNIILRAHTDYCPQSLYSLSGETSYRRSREVLKPQDWDVITIVSLWNFTDLSTALLARCLSNFRVIEKVWNRLSRLRDFKRSFGKTSTRFAVREITQSSSTISATSISSNIVWLIQLHDIIQMKSNYTWINYNHDNIAIRSHMMIYNFVWNLIFCTKFSSFYLTKGEKRLFFRLSFVNLQRAIDGTHMFDAKYKYVLVV